MKTRYPSLSALALLACSVLALAPKANAEISAGQARAVLRTIDATCGGSWCESDYNFHFTDFVCDPVTKICKIVFFMDQNEPLKLIEGDGFKATLKNSIAKGSCVFSGISDVNDMMGAQQGLNERFYKQLDGCLSALIEHAGSAKSGN